MTSDRRRGDVRGYRPIAVVAAGRFARWTRRSTPSRSRTPDGARDWRSPAKGSNAKLVTLQTRPPPRGAVAARLPQRHRAGRADRRQTRRGLARDRPGAGAARAGAVALPRRPGPPRRGRGGGAVGRGGDAAAAAHRSPATRSRTTTRRASGSSASTSKMPLPALSAAFSLPVSRLMAARAHGNEQGARAALEQLPAALDRVDALLADGLLGERGRRQRRRRADRAERRARRLAARPARHHRRPPRRRLGRGARRRHRAGPQLGRDRRAAPRLKRRRAPVRTGAPLKRKRVRRLLTRRRGASAPPRATAASSATGSRSGGCARA